MIRVAFCSEDDEHVDAHFAQSSSITIYEFGPSSYHKLGVIRFGPTGSAEQNSQGNSADQGHSFNRFEILPPQ
jgi:hypothetical protein